MAKHGSLDYLSAVKILNEVKLWAGGARIGWVISGGSKTGFPEAHKAEAAVDVFRDEIRISPEDWKVRIYFRQGPNPEIPRTLAISFFVGTERVFALDDAVGRGHKNPLGLGQPLDGKRVGFPHIHYPVSGASQTDAYAEGIDSGEPEAYWTIFSSRINMKDAPPLVLPQGEPKQGDLLS